MSTPILDRHPLDHANVVKILLGQSASLALDGLGPCLIIATVADSTAPEHAQGRIILNCLPITKQAADDAYRVAAGTHDAVRVKSLRKALKPRKHAP